MIVEDGYILQLSIDEAIRIFDDVYLSRTAARANGKTQMRHNFTAAWLEIRRYIMNERYSKLSSKLIESMNETLEDAQERNSVLDESTEVNNDG